MASFILEAPLLGGCLELTCCVPSLTALNLARIRNIRGSSMTRAGADFATRRRLLPSPHKGSSSFSPVLQRDKLGGSSNN